MKHSIKSLFLFLVIFLWGTLCYSQFIYFPYYGKNKVLYEKFDWNHYKTEHFEIYYYTDDAEALKNVAEMAESAYERSSQTLKHQLKDPIPLIYYTTFTDFEQTNLFQASEGVLGVAEPVLHRIALYGDMPLDQVQHLIEHEVAHIFEFDLLWGSPGGPIYAVSSPPGWIMEGFAEYNTQTWATWSALIVRDAVLNDRIPELTDSGSLYSRYPLPRAPSYDFGHAIYDFIETKYGKNAIREFWHSMKSSPFLGKKDPVNRTFKLKYREFGHDFKKYLRQKFKKFFVRENPEDYSLPIGPEFLISTYYFAFSHALSPSGDIVAVLTYNIKDNDIDIFLLSTKDGSVIKNITKGYTLRYEHIKYEIDPSNGRDITWSSDGDRIAFFARSGHKHSLFILNALTGKTLKNIKIPFDQPSSPCFFPDGKEVLFAAFDKGVHDIFKINLSTDNFLNLTKDRFFEKAPAISSDGKQVAYTIRVGSRDKLFISPLNNMKKKTQLTFGKGNTITPQFSQDSKELYFSGDMREAFNLYSIKLENGELTRYTDVRTGNFFPIPLPNEHKKLIFSSFNKGAFQIFLSEFDGEVEKVVNSSEQSSELELKRFESIVSVEIDKEKIKTYKGLGNLYLTSRPPIDAIVSTDGSIYGGSAISFSDILGDYNFQITAYQVRNFRSYSFSYLNLKRRLHYMASAYQYTLFYYYPYSYYDMSYYNFLTYRDAIATRKITGLNVGFYYPLNKYYRAQGYLSFDRYQEEFYDPFLFSARNQNIPFWNGTLLSASLAFIGETTRFKAYGPASGNTFRISLTQSIPVSGSFLKNTTIELDLRQYLYIGGDTLFALRFNGFASWGKNPYVFYFGGNNQVRSSNYHNIIANEGWFTNVEFRIPLVNAASTLIGQIGPIRGTFFFDIARSKVKGFPAKFYRFTGRSEDNFFVESDAIGSYGYGFEFFFLGLPIHLEFAKQLEFPKISSPFTFNSVGKFRTKFWIGFDF